MNQYYLIFMLLQPLFLMLIVPHFAFADKDCSRCMEFLSITHEYKKSVLDAAGNNTEIIPEIVQNYSQDILRLYNTSTPS
jgi:hypothetical protein